MSPKMGWECEGTDAPPEFPVLPPAWHHHAAPSLYGDGVYFKQLRGKRSR